MNFTFRKYLGQPAYPGCPATRCYPMISLEIIGPAGSSGRSHRAKLDTGADWVVFPEAVAALLGIDLAAIQTTTQASPASGAAVASKHAPVILELKDGAGQTGYRWRTHVGFAKVATPLFGIIGGLEHFALTFDISRDEFTLVAGSTLPATTDALP